jgi:hypothetical protein
MADSDQPVVKPFQVLARNDKEKMLAQALEIFEKRVDEDWTLERLAEYYDLNIKTIRRRIDQAEQHIVGELKEKGKQKLAEVSRRYDWLYQTAKKQWLETNNFDYWKAMESALKAIRQLYALDAPGKLPQTETGKTMADQSVVMVLNLNQYEKLESGDGEIIDGTFTDNTGQPDKSESED